jgi:hypothetical protein
MRYFSFVFFLIVIFLNSLNGQTRTITGRIIDEDLETIPEALINNSDTILLVKTDIDGKFLIQISTETKELVIGWVGMEWKTIILPNDCDNLDIILMFYANYDIRSHRKVDRKRKRRFNKLSEIHQIAYKKGLFCTEKPCQNDTER